MDYTIYKYSLGIALVLMLFFATYFLLAKTPEKPIFGNYVRSRRLMGCALLVLAANYSVHLFDGDMAARIQHLSADNPKTTVAEVSEASGFLSLSYFTKIFTEKEGISPSKWRKAN